jgi:hypothetical protein
MGSSLRLSAEGSVGNGFCSSLGGLCVRRFGRLLGLRGDLSREHRRLRGEREERERGLAAMEWFPSLMPLCGGGGERCGGGERYGPRERLRVLFLPRYEGEREYLRLGGGGERESRRKPKRNNKRLGKIDLS